MKTSSRGRRDTQDGNTCRGRDWPTSQGAQTQHGKCWHGRGVSQERQHSTQRQLLSIWLSKFDKDASARGTCRPSQKVASPSPWCVAHEVLRRRGVSEKLRAPQDSRENIIAEEDRGCYENQQLFSTAPGHALCEEAVASADQMLDVLGPGECGRQNNAQVLVRQHHWQTHSTALGTTFWSTASAPKHRDFRIQRLQVPVSSFGCGVLLREVLRMCCLLDLVNTGIAWVGLFDSLGTCFMSDTCFSATALAWKRAVDGSPHNLLGSLLHGKDDSLRTPSTFPEGDSGDTNKMTPEFVSVTNIDAFRHRHNTQKR